MLPEKFYLIHVISNLIAGFSFWGISYCFSVFIDRVQLKLKQDEKSNVGIYINKYSSVFSVISAVFFFCGLGHLLEAFVPWTEDFSFIILVHACTASLGATLVYLLLKNLYMGK